MVIRRRRVVRSSAVAASIKEPAVQAVRDGEFNVYVRLQGMTDDTRLPRLTNIPIFYRGDSHGSGTANVAAAMSYNIYPLETELPKMLVNRKKALPDGFRGDLTNTLWDQGARAWVNGLSFTDFVNPMYPGFAYSLVPAYFDNVIGLALSKHPIAAVASTAGIPVRSHYLFAVTPAGHSNQSGIHVLGASPWIRRVVQLANDYLTLLETKLAVADVGPWYLDKIK